MSRPGQRVVLSDKLRNPPLQLTTLPQEVRDIIMDYVLRFPKGPRFERQIPGAPFKAYYTKYLSLAFVNKQL